MMLENNCAQLNEKDCSNISRDVKASSAIGQILISRIKKIKNHESIEKEKEEKDTTNFTNKNTQ